MRGNLAQGCSGQDRISSTKTRRKKCHIWNINSYLVYIFHFWRYILLRCICSLSHSLICVSVNQNGEVFKTTHSIDRWRSLHS